MQALSDKCSRHVMTRNPSAAVVPIFSSRSCSFKRYTWLCIYIYIQNTWCSWLTCIHEVNEFKKIYMYRHHPEALSTSERLLSNFLPSTSTNCGSTCIGVDFGVIAGKQSLGHKPNPTYKIFMATHYQELVVLFYKFCQETWSSWLQLWYQPPLGHQNQTHRFQPLEPNHCLRQHQECWNREACLLHPARSAKEVRGTMGEWQCECATCQKVFFYTSGILNFNSPTTLSFFNLSLIDIEGFAKYDLDLFFTMHFVGANQAFWFRPSKCTVYHFP